MRVYISKLLSSLILIVYTQYKVSSGCFNFCICLGATSASGSYKIPSTVHSTTIGWRHPFSHSHSPHSIFQWDHIRAMSYCMLAARVYIQLGVSLKAQNPSCRSSFVANSKRTNTFRCRTGRYGKYPTLFHHYAWDNFIYLYFSFIVPFRNLFQVWINFFFSNLFLFNNI